MLFVNKYYLFKNYFEMQNLKLYLHSLCGCSVARLLRRAGREG